MDYTNENGFFRSEIDNTRLFYQSWIPANPRPNAHLVINHGFGEHSDRYTHVLEAFQGSGVSLYSMDMRGHGRSEGKRGDAPGVYAFAQDLETYLSLLRKERGIMRPLLLGHSLGGVVVLYFVLKHSNQWELSGLLTSGAALRVKQTPLMKIKKVSGRLLNLIIPETTMPAGLEENFISHDEEELNRYKTDPLIHGMLSIRLGMDILDASASILRRAEKLKIPLYMAHGEADGITLPSGSVEFFRNCSSANKKLMLYPELYHEIFNETREQRDRVLSDLKNWVMKRFAEVNSSHNPLQEINSVESV